MSIYLRILALAASAAFAISALGIASPFNPIAYLLESALNGSANPSKQSKPRISEPARVDPQDRQTFDSKPKPGEQFTIYQNENGEVTCRVATAAERKEMEAIDAQRLGLRPLNHHNSVDKTGGIQPKDAPNLTIVLRGTTQLQQNQAAMNAFNRAAQNWEDIIKSPVTIYIDVDYGATRFGQTWPSGVLGATSAPSRSYPYQSVRDNLIAQAAGEGNATKQAIFNALPGTTVPNNLGDATSTDVSDPAARAIGLLPATAQSTDNAARIAFNSSFTFDFDPSDGITAGQIDFDAVATHEIGHALGFASEAGSNIAKPSVWDLYRFRTGVTTGTFTAAQRILTVGGSPDPLQFYFVPGNAELGLSTGGPAGSTANGGDGWQSSHWKHVTGCSPTYIGVMDPAIPSGCRRTITVNDKLALTSFGYNLTNNNPPPAPPAPPPAPANDNFVNAQTISGCSGSITGATFGATNEANEPSHSPTDASSLSPNHTVWYQWQATSSGTATITTMGSDFDTMLAVYTGTSVGSLTRIASNDDAKTSGVLTSRITWNATAGTTYQIAVDGWGGDAGTVKLNWNACVAPLPPPNDNFANRQTISGCSGSLTGSTAGATSETNEPNHCPFDSAAHTPGHTVWFKWSTPTGSPGAMTLTTQGSNFDTILAVYIDPGPSNGSTGLGSLIRIISNDDGSPGTLTSSVTFSANPGSLYVIVVDGWDGDSGNFQLNWTQTNCTPPTPTPTPSPTPKPTCLDDMWIQTGTTNVPAARKSHTAIWTGTEMIVWGGQDASPNYLNSGARYNPATDTWTAIGITNAPAPRANHSAVWTGSEMIIWGGTNGGLNHFSTGARYNPTTNSWTSLSTINAPVARSFHKAIWTGSEMIVWGGQNNNGIQMNGSRYNPATDTWTPMSTVNAPAARGSDSAVWTGAEMIIWGGAGVGLLNSGGRYNPISNTWTATNTANAPEARAGHTAVWTGIEMIVWGGAASASISTGGRYNPISDSWTATTTANAPEPRTGHNAVWIGTEMIVWGGGRGTNERDLRTNGRYDPATNTWIFTCETNAPVGRAYSTAVWTGGQMVVWGGEDSVLHVLNSGGRYSIPGQNPIDYPIFFVRRHYLDFLNREPDQSGWNFWTNQITSCGTDVQCLEVRRVNVSASFFLSIEFQQSGYLVERIYKVAYGNATGNSTFNGAHQLSVPVVRFSEFLQGTQRIGQGVIVLAPGWEQLLENNKQAYALEFVQTLQFINAFPTTMTPAGFVDKLNTNAGNVLSAGERTTLVNLFGVAADSSNINARAQAVRQVAEDTDLYNAEYNRAFVLAEYYGYLRRNPNDPPESTLDYTGYDFWLTKLNQFNGNYINAEMVKAFLSSIEYRQRFGP